MNTNPYNVLKTTKCGCRPTVGGITTTIGHCRLNIRLNSSSKIE